MTVSVIDDKSPRLTEAQQSLVESVMPTLRRQIKSVTPRFYPHTFEELLQVGSEAASRVARKHVAGRGSFLTYCWPRVLGEIIDYAESDRKRRAALGKLQRGLTDWSEVFSDAGDPLAEPPEERVARFQELRDAMGAALALGYLCPTTPEDAFLEEEERARIASLARTGLEALDLEHRETATRYFFDGESLEAIFGSRGVEYFAARGRFIRALARVGRELRRRLDGKK
ncbi:MAG: hypothetical protein U0414_36240 [Polyangiaceae bacterium]